MIRRRGPRRTAPQALATIAIAASAGVAALTACEGNALEPRAPGAQPLDEAIPADTTPGPSVRTLSVNLADGVAGIPPAGNQRLEDTVTIGFDYRAAIGFENVLVQLDGKAVSSSGTVAMVSDHELAATADRRLPLGSDDLDLIRDVRALLTSSNVSGDWAIHRSVVDSLYQTVVVAEARKRLSAVYASAFDPVADSTQMRALMQTLGGQTYGTTAVPPGETLLLFVNGLTRWPTEPAWAESQLRAIVSALGLTGVTTGHFYNDTPTGSADFTAATCMLQAASRHLVSDPIRILLTGAGFLQWPVLYGGCVPVADLDVGRQAVLDALGHAPPAADPTVAALAARIQQETAASASVILVAHSQGNLLVREALAALGAPQACVGVVSLGAPTSAGWPVAGEEFGAIVVAGDIALATGLNSFLATDTNVAAALRDLTLLARSFVAAEVADLTDELFPHLSVESYLTGDASAAALRSLLAAQVATLQQRTACGGP